MAETAQETWKVRFARAAVEGMRRLHIPERYKKEDQAAVAEKAWRGALAEWLKHSTAREIFFPFLEARVQRAKQVRKAAFRSHADMLLAQGVENGLDDLLDDLRNLMSPPASADTGEEE